MKSSSPEELLRQVLVPATQAFLDAKLPNFPVTCELNHIWGDLPGYDKFIAYIRVPQTGSYDHSYDMYLALNDQTVELFNAYQTAMETEKGYNISSISIYWVMKGGHPDSKMKIMIQICFERKRDE